MFDLICEFLLVIYLQWSLVTLMHPGIAGCIRIQKSLQKSYFNLVLLFCIHVVKWCKNTLVISKLDIEILYNVVLVFVFVWTTTIMIIYYDISSKKLGYVTLIIFVRKKINYVYFNLRIVSTARWVHLSNGHHTKPSPKVLRWAHLVFSALPYAYTCTIDIDWWRNYLPPPPHFKYFFPLASLFCARGADLDIRKLT